MTFASNLIEHLHCLTTKQVLGLRMAPLQVMVIGAGSRGTAYSEYALEHPDRMKVVAVAEPRAEYRERLVRAHDVPEGRIFSDWKVAEAQGKIADAVIHAAKADQKKED